MSAMRVGLVQLNGSGDVAGNIERTAGMIHEAAAQGAQFIATPEVTNMIAPDRDTLFATIRAEADDTSLATLRAVAAELGITLLIGSLALKAEGEEDRAINRSFLIGPEGGIVARYDKIHMFEAYLGDKGTFREAASYRPGAEAILAPVRDATLGMTVCYDLRFPQLYRALARGGAQILSVPSAFTKPTGEAHWHILLRARAIETGCFVIAPAQWGPHNGKDETSLRESYGHSLIIAPWGEVLGDAGTGEGIVVADLNIAEVAKARARVPSLGTDAEWRLG